MALAAKQNERTEVKRAPAQVVPMPGPGHSAGIGNASGLGPGRTLHEHVERVSPVARNTRQSALQAYKQVRRQTLHGYSRLLGRAQDLGKRTQNQARQVRQEHPLHLIAIIAGVAFAAGISIRLWRSRT
jgi:hypothetical protein